MTNKVVFYLEPAFFNVWEYGWLNGYCQQPGVTAIKVPYTNLPTAANAAEAAKNLDIELRGAPNTDVVVVGHSEGSQGACEWLREYAPTTSVDPARVSFILCGNPERRYGGILGMMQGAPKRILQAPTWLGGVHFPPPGSVAAYVSQGYLPGVPLDTPFTVLDLARQYDHFADYPSSSASVSSAASQNASTSVHVNYFNVNINDSDIVTHTEGNITWAWKPTYPVMSAQWTWNPTQKLAKDRADRPAIEACYQRPVTLPTP